MMQNRDFFRTDYIFQHTKLANMNDFTEQMFNATRHQKQIILLSKQDQLLQSTLYSSLITASLTTLGISLLTVVFYRKIPYLNRVEKRWKRILIKGSMLVIPVQLVSLIGQQSQMQILESLFMQYQSKFQDYLFTGDVKCLNSDIKISPV